MDKNESILIILKRLYTKIFLVSLHNRISSYHASLDLNHHHQEIGDILHNLINETINDISLNNSSSVYPKLTNPYEEENLDNTNSKTIKNEPTTTSMTINGLSLYFKKNKALDQNPSMAARLRRCVWDHVHTVHRLSRNGDENTARLHVNIACDAMKTLSHFMEKEEYNEFFKLVSTQINDNQVTSDKQ